MTFAADEHDVVDLLLAQHQQIKHLIGEIPPSTGQRKQELFEDLVRLLAAHESAEEEIVHPAARKSAGAEVVNESLDEESAAKSVLAELFDIGVDAEGFDARFASLASDLVNHVEHEEREEFALLRASQPHEQLTWMAGAVREAEAAAPSPPHPGAGESGRSRRYA